jgi:hypothetical protein
MKKEASRRARARATEGVEKCQPANWKRGSTRGAEDRRIGAEGRLSTAAPTSNKHARTRNFEY